MPRPTLGDQPMTPAQRKARQRRSAAAGQRATAEAIDATLLAVVKDEIAERAEKIAAGETYNMDMLFVLLRAAHRFPEDQRRKVFDRFNIDPIQAGVLPPTHNGWRS